MCILEFCFFSLLLLSDIVGEVLRRLGASKKPILKILIWKKGRMGDSMYWHCHMWRLCLRHMCVFVSFHRVWKIIMFKLLIGCCVKPTNWNVCLLFHVASSCRMFIVHNSKTKCQFCRLVAVEALLTRDTQRVAMPVPVRSAQPFSSERMQAREKRGKNMVK